MFWDFTIYTWVDLFSCIVVGPWWLLSILKPHSFSLGNLLFLLSLSELWLFGYWTPRLLFWGPYFLCSVLYLLFFKIRKLTFICRLECKRSFFKKSQQWEYKHKIENLMLHKSVFIIGDIAWQLRFSFKHMALLVHFHTPMQQWTSNKNYYTNFGSNKILYEIQGATLERFGRFTKYLLIISFLVILHWLLIDKRTD